MGVRIHERFPGQFWIYVNHNKQRCAKPVGSQEAAQEAKRIFQEQIAIGAFQFPRREEKKRIITLADYYERFAATYLKGGVRESTAERYKQCFTHHLLPTLGAKGLDNITRENLKALIASLVEKNLAKYTIRNITACLCSVLSHAVEDRIIPQNPATKLGRYFQEARVVHDQIEPLTESEVPIFLQKTRERDARRAKGNPEYCPLFFCAIHTGMRAGELAGLQWPDIDWRGKYLIVRRSIRKGKLYQTKTGRIRRIDMSDDLIAELEAYRRRRLEEALKAGKNEIPEWVFGTCEGTPLDMHNVERREFEKCLAAAKLRRIRFHDLRHTTASLLLQNGASPAYVKDQLGHSSIKVTVDIYGHLVPGANRQEMNKLPGFRQGTRQTTEGRKAG